MIVPQVHPDVWALRPDFTALSIVATGVRNGPGAAPAAGTPVRPPWAEAHLGAWRDAYRAFGARPQRTPCSAEALWRRFERDGVLGRVNTVVDLYNLVSLRYAVPVGGEDLDTYVGVPRLVRARGDEVFATVREGRAVDEVVEPGEVIWRDAAGATCRRWNWRQGTRTRVQPSSSTIWFVLERLAPMPLEALTAAGDELAAGLQALDPGTVVEMTLLREQK